MEFLDRLLDEMEEPIDDGRRRRKKKKKKPATKEQCQCNNYLLFLYSQVKGRYLTEGFRNQFWYLRERCSKGGRVYNSIFEGETFESGYSHESKYVMVFGFICLLVTPSLSGRTTIKIQFVFNIIFYCCYELGIWPQDFACCDCGRAFYFQKNLFTHVVEAHGKSVDELPNLARVKSEDGIIRWVYTGLYTTVPTCFFIVFPSKTLILFYKNIIGLIMNCHKLVYFYIFF